jgi:hypothetical protein
MSIKRMQRNWKMATSWLLGTFCILIAVMISGNLYGGVGMSDSGFYMALFVSFLLILLGGLFWISVAVAIKTSTEM